MFLKLLALKMLFVVLRCDLNEDKDNFLRTENRFVPFKFKLMPTTAIFY